MAIALMRKAALWAMPLIALFAYAKPLCAQLVQDAQPTAKQAAVQTPPGKSRVSQEIQITGDQFWSDTGIDVQPGEHIIVHASGTLRYADAKSDNGPDGITRGYKDLIRILPFNS